MSADWNDGLPIYRQLRDLVVAGILDESLAEGDALPSVRSVAAEYRVNPLTVLKAYQALAEDDLVESRRGLGMFVREGARKALLRSERERFLTDEWPAIRARIQRLGLTEAELLRGAAPRGSTRAPRAPRAAGGGR